MFECDSDNVQRLIDLFQMYKLPLNETPRAHKVLAFNFIQSKIN